ncbi:synaptotagmin-like protein 2 isoform X3 [Hyperolius riggenbachi]|uniref:synaptotagmin-like protein 2 isoform X3 n=1 Tax=Hyperolius riggenbachi TaxID=752182 RepID=UPI0035A30A84
MIDLSFLTEAEQESILKVLNRDSELKKAEDERVRQLHNAVDDENEFKYKSGQWFYDAKSRRHRDKVHGADLVRASIRKRKKPQTLELSGVIMEAPDEAEEDIALKKEAGTESSNKVNDTTSPEKGPDTLKNGAVPSSKQRLNPFNTEGLKDETDYKNEPPSLTPEIEATKPPKSKSDIMSSLAKYGVRLPYAADLPKGPQVSSKAKDDDHAQNQAVPPPVPKPRTLRMNGQQDASNSSLKSEDSFNGMHKPRGILKRRSSSSSTDSESIRIAQTLEANKIVLPGSPILEAGQNNFFDEQDSTSDNSSDRLKQVRFSEKVHQRPPTPTPDAYSVREIGEYGILDPGLLLSDLDSGFDDHHGSEDSFPGQYSDSAGGYNDSTKAPQQNATSKSQGVSLAVQPQSLEVERNQVNLEEEKSQKNNKLIKPETNSDISLELPDSHSTGLNALYAAVRKTPPATSPQQSQDFDLDDALMEPTFHGQRDTTRYINQNEKSLEFGKSYGGGGKITFDGSTKPKGSYTSFSEEDFAPEKAINTETANRNLEHKPTVISDESESFPPWRRPFVFGSQEPRSPSDMTKEKMSKHDLSESPKIDFKDDYLFVKPFSDNLPQTKYSSGDYGGEIKYKSMFLQNQEKAEHRPDGLATDLPGPYKSRTSGGETFLRENKGRKDLPSSANFKVLSLKDRIEMPSEQLSNPSQFQSLKHFWNVEEKNQPRETKAASPDRILTDISIRNKPARADLKQRNSQELPSEGSVLPNTYDSLSEEEQTSQKVASWLAQTPGVFGVDQMDRSEDQLYPVEGIVEHVQKSTIPKKTDEEFTNALQKLREESLEAPRVTETRRLKTEEIQIEPQEKKDFVDRKQTITVSSSVSRNLLEPDLSPTNLNKTDRGFYTRVIERSSTQSPAKDAFTSETKREPIEENIEKTVAPTKTASEFQMSFEKLKEEYDSLGELQTEQPPQPSGEPTSETVEVIEKSAASKSPDQHEFVSALKKLEIEALNPPLMEISNARSPAKEYFTKETMREPIEENIEKTVAPAKTASEFKISFEKLKEEYDSLGELQTEQPPQPSEEPANETVEIVEKSAASKSPDTHEFITALKKLEIEASKPPLISDVDAEVQNGLAEEEEMRPETVSLVKSPFKISFEHFSSSKDNEFEALPVVDPAAHQPQQRYLPNKGADDAEVCDFDETVEKTRVPSRKDEELSTALRKLELEAFEHQPVDENVVSVNQVVEFEKPESRQALQTELEEDHSYLKDSIKFRKEANELEPLPQASTCDFKRRYEDHQPDIFDGRQPVVEETVESSIVENQESGADFHNRLLRLEEAAAIIPEEPEDLLANNTVRVSQYPNREVLISKKVYSSIESTPTSPDYSVESKKAKQEGLEDYPVSKPTELDVKSRDYPPHKELANHSNLPADNSGLYVASAGNVPYKNPEVASPEALNSKPGMDESHPILSALKRSAAKTLNSKAALDISPTSANQINASSPTEDTTGPVENSFPENAEKFKRMSQSVPAFLQDEICPCAPDVLTDGRDTDSASESSFQIGRHKKSPSSLTNLSGSSGMASMSSVSGSVMSVYSGDFGNVDVKGGIEFQVVYMDQLKEFFIYVYQCKDLAAADVKKQRSDPYVKAYLLPEKAKMGKRKTAVKKKTLDPVYNEILKYKIPKQSLLAQTLNLSVWHHDALGRNSFLGEVNLNLATVDWDNKDRAWYQLQPRTPSAGIGLENRGEMKLSLKYVPRIPSETNTKAPLTGEVHIWIRECVQLPKLRDKINSFVKCTVLPDTSRKSRQKTRTVDKTPNPIFNHTMVYDGFKTEDLREACVELTVWDHNRLSNHFLGGLRIGLGSGKSYGTVVDWMDSTHEESTMWEKMMASPNIWVDGMLPLRMFKMAKLAK